MKTKKSTYRQIVTRIRRPGEHASNGDVVGWISLSDCLLLGIGVLLAFNLFLRKESVSLKENLSTNVEEFHQKDFDTKQEIDRLKSDNAYLKDMIARVQASSNDYKKKQSDEREREVLLKRELVGFKGDLRRVAFLIDNSGSMVDRWPDAKHRIKNWITELDIKECIVITFNYTNRVIKFPQEVGEVYKLDGDARQRSIDQIEKILNDSEPTGFTDTYSALKVAYGFEGIDTIVLFTDGAPYLGDEEYQFEGKPQQPDVETTESDTDFDNFLIAESKKLCQRYSHIPVNVVGVGDFYEPNFASFLIQLAKISDGTFLGRGD